MKRKWLLFFTSLTLTSRANWEIEQGAVFKVKTCHIFQFHCVSTFKTILGHACQEGCTPKCQSSSFVWTKSVTVYRQKLNSLRWKEHLYSFKKGQAKKLRHDENEECPNPWFIRTINTCHWPCHKIWHAPLPLKGCLAEFPHFAWYLHNFGTTCPTSPNWPHMKFKYRYDTKASHCVDFSWLAWWNGHCSRSRQNSFVFHR